MGVKDVKSLVYSKIHTIGKEVSAGGGNAILAQLRRGVGKVPGEVPEILGIVLEDMPEEYYSKTGKPTKEEWAIYITMTLFAVHQQGAEGKRLMHSEQGGSIGAALGRLALTEQDSNASDRMMKRMKSVLTAADVQGCAYYLRGIIRLLKNESIPLDYVKLAGDIYSMQFNDGRTAIGLRWGQDFFGRLQNKSDEASKNDEHGGKNDE